MNINLILLLSNTVFMVSVAFYMFNNNAYTKLLYNMIEHVDKYHTDIRKLDFDYFEARLRIQNDYIDRLRVIYSRSDVDLKGWSDESEDSNGVH